MKQAIELKDMDVVVLCGGKGERLQSVVNDRPKPMAEIKGSPFLDILINYAASFDFRRFILCAGYMSDFISRYYRNIVTSATVLISEEKEPLGTGGAIKKAESIIRSDPFLVLNGDSLCRLDLKEFVEFHTAKKALCSVALTKAKEICDGAAVRLKSSQEIVGFREKQTAGYGDYLNAGVYLFNAGIFSMMPANKKFSLEYDLFPKIIDERFYGYTTGASLIDIGTPERYKEARILLKEPKG